MDNKSLIPCMLILIMFFCRVRSDFGQDKKECKDQLISLSPCITFVSGDAKAPTPACCTELKRNIDKSKYCLCVLVKDRDEPALGFKLNATRAISLVPYVKSTRLLHCVQNSYTYLQTAGGSVFEQFGNISSVGNSTSVGEVVPSSSTRLSVEGIRQAVIIIAVLFSVSAVCSH